MTSSYFTSESVTEGHPDKVADAISDSVLDAALRVDSEARVACEVFVTTRFAVVGGEISVAEDLDLEEIVRSTVRSIGYDGFDEGFSADSITIENRVQPQSPDIAVGVNDSGEGLGAGDQGMMFGFAVEETVDLMPMPIQLAHRLAEQLSEVRKTKKLDYLRPDGKTQVMVRYEGNSPVAVDKILISAHHSEGQNQEEMAEDVFNTVVAAVIPESMLDDNVEFLFNPTGIFTVGGPVADTGLTGRKIIVDTYGGYARHGGGAFSGKDSSKVDRSGAYAARWAAKNLVAAGVAAKLEIQVAYAIGQADPFSIQIDTFGTERIAPDRISAIVQEAFDFRPASIIETLRLRSPGFAETAAYGHFGRPEFSWEQLDKVDEIKQSAGL
jgi:S-adenosylmethionine synthetase